LDRKSISGGRSREGINTEEPMEDAMARSSNAEGRPLLERQGSKAPPPPRARILIVDDTAANRSAFQAVLSDIADVVLASSGREALQILSVDDFAVILLDIRMPVLDGIETALLIRKRPYSRQTPIIFVSAYEKTPVEVAEGKFTGPIDYLFSPVDSEALRRKVGTLVELHLQGLETRRQLDEALRANRILEQRIRDLEANVR
jgi:CheY-like chemotaxis protein